MRTVKKLSFALSLGLATSACGLLEKLKEDEPTEQARAKPGPPIPHERLMQLMPSPEGWETSERRGELKRLGEADISRALTLYSTEAEGETRRIKLEIVDGNGVSSVYTPFALFAHARENAPEVHRIQFEHEGHPILGEWDSSTGNARVVLLVARRFRVSLNGEHITPQVVRQYLQSIDVKQLAAWAESNASPTPAEQ